jgi:hypothetical protein
MGELYATIPGRFLRIMTVLRLLAIIIAKFSIFKIRYCAAKAVEPKTPLKRYTGVRGLRKDDPRGRGRLCWVCTSYQL